MSARGTFLLTFDVELLWGLFFDARWRRRALRRYGTIREVFDEILEVLARHRVRATFAFVGHLFLDRCPGGDGRRHPEMPRPRDPGGAWYRFDPGTDLARDPLWYGRDLVERVRSAGLRHEIGAHGFSHALFSGSAALARAEARAAAEAARRLGIEVRSFVYPRNVVGHREALREAGFTHYRAAGAGRSRASAFLGALRGRTPPTGLPRRVDGLVEVPTSAPIPPAVGLRRLVPLRSRLREVAGGLARAAETGTCFHLWTHPHNFVEGRRGMMRYLDRALSLVARARDRGAVEVRTMGEVSP